MRRSASGQEWWYVYGISGELVAEYGAGFTGASVQQEYGYRGGELLVTATPYGSQGLQGDYFNSLDFTGPALTRNDPSVNFEWHSATPGGGVNADIFTARWTGYVTPRYTETYTFYTQSDDGARLWVNDQLLVDKWIDQGWTEWSGQITLQAGKRYKIRMEFYERYWGAIAKLFWSSPSQLKEIIPSSQLTPPQGASVKWIVTDQLSSPRMVLDQTGSLSRMTRHDYLPFGEEIGAGVGGRLYSQGYISDGTRQQFTGQERDGETGLDYMKARYFSNLQGRFTSADSMSGSKLNPQSFNLYAYALNNPLRYTDPSGHMPAAVGWSGAGNGFWGGDPGFFDPHFGGPGIVNDRMSQHDQSISTRIDGIRAQHYLDQGNWAAAIRIMRDNPDVGLYVNGEAIWGATAAGFVRETVGDCGCTLQVRGRAGAPLTKGNPLRFPGKKQTLGPAYMDQVDLFGWQVEITGTTSDDISTWLMYQTYEGSSVVESSTEPKTMTLPDSGSEPITGYPYNYQPKGGHRFTSLTPRLAKLLLRPQEGCHLGALGD